MSMFPSKIDYWIFVEPRCWVTVILMVALYFIAGSVGCGWMFLLSAALLSAVAAALFMPLVCLKNLAVEQRVPQTMTAGEPLTIKIVLKNANAGNFFGRLLPPQLLAVRHQWGLRRGRSGPIYDSIIDCVQSEVSTTLSLPGLARGVHHYGAAFVRSSFPLGLVWWERRFDYPGTIVVYPALRTVEGLFLYRIKALGTGAFGSPKESTALQSIFTRSVRDYVRGDSPRNIHWSSTARTGRLMVREFDAEGLPSFDIELDLKAQWRTQEQFETAVATVASLVALGQRLGINPELKLNPGLSELDLGPMPDVLPGYELQMEILARIQPLHIGSEPVAARRDPLRILGVLAGVMGATAEPASDSAMSAPVRQRERAEERTLVIVCPKDELKVVPDNSFIVEIAAPAQPDIVATEQAGSSYFLVSSLEDIERL